MPIIKKCVVLKNQLCIYTQNYASINPCLMLLLSYNAGMID